MYGTIARMRVKPGAGKRLSTWSEQMPIAKGEIAAYVYQSDKDSNEMWLCAIFESKEAYHANANSPEQHQRFTQMMQFLEAEPDWHDGEITYARQERTASTR